VPFRLGGFAGRMFLTRFVLRFVFHRLLTVSTPLGRKVRARILSQGGPLIRVKPQDLTAAQVERVPKTVGVRDGLPVLEDGRILDVANVIWCTGFNPSSSWIDLPVFANNGEPIHERGKVANEPGLYFVGRHFLYAMSSTMIHGVGRDAEHIVDVIAARTAEARRPAAVTSARPAPMGGAAVAGGQA
jgi:putative flavoprotein involved in K+ transport